MRFAPRTLFGRLVLVLLTGLVFAQFASLAVHLHERGELLSQASGMQAAQRIADIVKLLDTLAPAERRRIVKTFSAPQLAISLDEPPLAAAEQGAEAAARTALFGAMLRRQLGGERQMVVRLAAPAQARSRRGPMAGFKGKEMREGWGPWAGMHAGTGADFAFVTQVRLGDGTLATFNAEQPARTGHWPYRLLASVAVLLVAVIALSWLAVRWTTRPLAALAEAADELGRNLGRPPMPEEGPLEVVRAARAFNTMQSRLAGYVNDRTRVLAAMSHDLKTPITRLRLRAELLEDGEARARFGKDLDDMEAMVRDTLEFLKGLESGEPVALVDVAALLESIKEDREELGGRVEIEGRAASHFPGRPRALRRCIANLVDNAVKYGKSAVIAVNESDARLELGIRDEGPGLPEAELERVFDPFYRAEGSRSRETGGTGLGLTIARGIAEAHGGSLVLRNRGEGGLEAVLTLPRAGAGAAAGGR